MSILELIEEMGETGVLGAGRLHHATQLFSKMIKDEETTVFLSVAGPLVPGGLRKIIREISYIEMKLTCSLRAELTSLMTYLRLSEAIIIEI